VGNLQRGGGLRDFTGEDDCAMSEDDDGVIRPDFTAKHSLVISHRTTFCPHRHVLVSEDDRTVECGACGAILDPFAVILMYAKEERSFAYAKGCLAKLSKQVQELKAEEKRIKARLDRAKSKASKQGVLL
jgi:hypothetical protein